MWTCPEITDSVIYAWCTGDVCVLLSVHVFPHTQGLSVCVCMCVWLSVCIFSTPQCSYSMLSCVHLNIPVKHRCICISCVCVCVNPHWVMLFTAETQPQTASKVHVRWGMFAGFGRESGDFGNVGFDVEMNDSSSLGTAWYFYIPSRLLLFSFSFGPAPTV